MRDNPIVQTVLALETSCDESAVAIARSEADQFSLIASLVASQVEEHAKWGGVVPEIASRRHLESLPFLVGDALNDAGIKMDEIDVIAATVAPGLSGALMVGSVTGRTLASLFGLPYLGIHHLEAHLASVHLANSAPKFPYIVLLVSGGHTELINVQSPTKFIRLGRSHDDAAGEAFDKVARLLGMTYPGGPAIQQAAKKGNPGKFSLPKCKVSKPGGGFYPYDFSFSGLKTAVLREVESIQKQGEEIPFKDLAASFEKAVVDVLVDRSIKCVLDHRVETLVMVGGVAANDRLRRVMNQKAAQDGIEVHMAPKAFCTDNAAMVAAAALLRLKSGVSSSSIELGVSARLPLDQAGELYKSIPPF